ncbi:MAG: hypothetical protein ACE5IR_17990 [bacterium]
MQIIAFILLAFGGGGLILSIYLLFTVKSPLLKTDDGKKIVISGISLQTILNLIFIYFTVLHAMFVLIGLGFLIGS